MRSRESIADREIERLLYPRSSTVFNSGVTDYPVEMRDLYSAIQILADPWNVEAESAPC